MLLENADEPYAGEISREAVSRLKRGKTIDTTGDLRQVVEDALAFLPAAERRETVKKSCQRTFQALRIDVNNEFEALYSFMEKLPGILAPNWPCGYSDLPFGEDRIDVRKALSSFIKKDFTVRFLMRSSGLPQRMQQKQPRPFHEDAMGDPGGGIVPSAPESALRGISADG